MSIALIVSASNAEATLYATRTQSSSTVVLIQGLDKTGPLFKHVCEVALNSVRGWSTIVRTSFVCASDQRELEIQLSDRTKTFGTVVRIDYRNSKLTLSFRSLSIEDSVYPKVVVKGDFDPSDSNFDHALESAVASYGAFDRNQVAIREQLIQNFVAAELIEKKKSSGDPTATSEMSVEKREFSKAYENFNRQDPENKRYVAAGLMSAAILGVGTINYYREHNPNVQFADDSYESFGESMKRRLDFSALRFDDNTQLTNIGHMYAGTIHYTIARSSGLNRWESLLHTFVFSSLWEYFSEYKQSVSINDQISTTLGGFIIGENLHQISRILKKDGGGPVKRLFATIFGGPQRLSQWAESTVRKTEGTFSDSSLSTAQQDFWSHLDLFLGGERRDGKTVVSVGMEAEVVNIPKMDRPGEFSALLLDETVQSKFHVEMGRGADIKTFKLFAKTTLAAYYKKKMHLNERQRLEGYQFFVGPAMMVDIDAKLADGTTRSSRTDISGVIGVLGNTLDLRAVSGDLQVHAVIDVYGDFATVRSLAFAPATGNRYVRDEFIPGNCDGIQSVMCNYSYYFGIGWTTMAQLDVAYGKLSAGVNSQKTSLTSIEGRSRFADSQRLNAKDSTSKANAWVAYEISRDVRVELGYERRSHVSRYGGKTVTAREAIARGRLILKLQ